MGGRDGIVICALGLLACGHRATPPAAEPCRSATPAGTSRLPSALKRSDPCKGRQLSTEAREALDKIKVGAKAFFQADHYDTNGNLLEKRFPVYPDLGPKAPAADLYAPTVVGWTPESPCCKQPSTRCESKPADWNSPVWRALHFQITEPFDFQLRYSTRGVNKKASFTLEALEDRGCLGSYCIFRVTGTVDQEFGVKTVGPMQVFGKGGQ